MASERVGGELRLWLDDIRRPPKGWVWVRTVATAKAVLATDKVVEASLDHDLGVVQIVEPETQTPSGLFSGDQNAETGTDLAKWMAENGHIPAFVRIHSWNPVGARSMATYLPTAVIEPFSASMNR